MRHGLPRGILRDLLRGESSTLARPFETYPATAGPTQQVSVHIGNTHQGIVKRSQNIGDAGGDILRALGLNDFFGGSILTKQLCRRGSSARDRPSGFGGLGGFSGLFSRLDWLVRWFGRLTFGRGLL